MEQAPHSVPRIPPFLRRALANVLIVAGMTLLLFMLFEGFSSTLLLLADLRGTGKRLPAERAHTTYDSVLGWRNVPRTRLPNQYGEGKSLTINSKGFRGVREVEDRVPAGKVRVICSGDSFTMGYGVADEACWCELLSSLDPRLETVNMGQGGYGLDQAYLWYARDGIRLDQDFLLLALITEDFMRMKRRDFLGYGKPVLVLEKGELRTENVPVPWVSYRFEWWHRRVGDFRKLRTLQLAERLMGPATAGKEPVSDLTGSETWQIALEVFEAFRNLAGSRGARLVLVSLPDSEDYRVSKSDPWRESLAREASRQGITFVDLVEEIRRLPQEKASGLFNASLHYDEAGNRWVAEALLNRLRSLPEITRRVEERAAGRLSPSLDSPSADPTR